MYRGEQVSAAVPIKGKPTQEPERKGWTYVPPNADGPFAKPFAALQPYTYTAWDVGDDETALYRAENGDLQFAVQLCEAIERDGVAKGLLTTRSAGLLSLPLEITGPDKLVKKLGGQKRSGLFWKIFPHAALARIVRMGILLGAGIGYFVDIDGVPVLHVIEHQWLFHRKDYDGTWRVYYRTPGGDIEITPGDGRWFVFAPWGWERFWIYGAWSAVGKFYISKLVSVDQQNTWGSRLARGILWVQAPNGSTTAERDGVVALIAGAIAPPVLAMLEGWELKNIDVQGRGFEVWKNGKEDANNEIRMALSGQIVTSGGQTLGFGTGNIFADIAKTFIICDADALGESIHYHGLVPWAELEGESKEDAPWAEFDTIDPAEKKLYAESLKLYGEGLSAVAKGHADIQTTERFDVKVYADKMGVDLVLDEAEEPDNVVDISGIKVVVEYQEGSIRQGKSADGSPWATLMVGASYGEIVGTEGEDGERIDAYVGPYSRVSSAFVLEQLREDGSRDEFKIFLGFASLEHAQNTFRRLGREDLEGEWIEVPIALLRGMISGDPSPMLPKHEESELDEPVELPVLSPAPKSTDIDPVVQVEADAAPDEPTDAEAVALAEDMTLHKIARCEHKRVNECPKCGVERVRGVLVGDDGKPVLDENGDPKWKIAWRAIKKATS
jgi:hypothetical protein